MVFSPDVPEIYMQTYFPVFSAYSTMTVETLANNDEDTLYTYFCEYIHEVNS